MSYILDALRRAEAERQREQAAVPGVLSPSLGEASPAAPDAAEGRRAPVLLGLALGAAAVALLALGAWWASRTAPAPSPAPQPGPAASATTLAAPMAAPVPVPVPAPVASPVAAPTPVAPVAAAVPAPPAATSAPVATEPLPWQRLPEGTRQRIGPWAVSGAMHSPDPSGRLLIVNGQVLREGDTVAPGVVLEEIQPRAAVLRVNGQRVLLSH